MQIRGFWQNAAPALTLAVLAPMVAEVLPGATRFSSIFVLPIEICVWGLGAVIIREVVRRWRLDWRGIICLALALSVAEEFLIQQTSVAPMVIHLKGVVYARAFGVNYVYLFWALIYETIFVVIIPVFLAEVVFSQRRTSPWLSRLGASVTGLFFVVGMLLAWFSWTHIARPKVFGVPVYQPPLATTLLACAVIALLIAAAVRWRRNGETSPAPKELFSLPSWGLAACSLVWAVLLYGLVLLGFGIAPAFPPGVAVATGLILGGGPLVLLSLGFRISDQRQIYWLVTGATTGAMLAGFVGFIGASRQDLIFKIVADSISLGLLLVLRTKVREEALH